MLGRDTLLMTEFEPIIEEEIVAIDSVLVVT